MLLIKNVEIRAPKNLGIKDVLIGGEKILHIADQIDFASATIIDGKNKILTPGFIDNHVHVTGGGGEAGFFSKAPEVKCSKLLEGGVTTVCGLLGTDGITRDVENLVSKLYGLRELGISAYGYTGSYRFPTNTLTGDIEKDIAFIDPIIGLKIAISDHRSSNISNEELARIATEARVAGMISKKAGIVIVHVGDGKRGISPIIEVLEDSEIPKNLFLPTHCNRNKRLLNQSIEYLKVGGQIDLTCGLPGNDRPSEVIKNLIDSEISIDKLTISSDGNGSWSRYDTDGNLIKIGVASVSSLLKEFKEMISIGIDISTALKFMTINPARILKLDSRKGSIDINKDADLILFDENLNIDSVIARGNLLLKDGEVDFDKVIEF